MQLRDDITVLIGSTDKRRWLWDEFNYAFYLHFLPVVNVYFLTEKKKNSAIETINFPKNSWSEHLMYALSYWVNTRYILWLQDDYFLIKKIMSDELKNDIKYIKENGIDRLGLCPISSHYTIGESDGEYVRMMDESRYLISLQPSIWEKHFFYENLRKEDSPWDFELKGTERIRGTGSKIYIRPKHWYLGVVRNGKYNKHYPKAKEILGL